MRASLVTLLLLPNFVFTVFAEEGGCLVQHELQDSIGLFYDTEPINEIAKGSYATQSTKILYKCNENYTLDGITENHCIKGRWTVSTHPKCIKFCPPITSGISINATCEFQNEKVSCSQQHKSGAIANIDCAFGYHKPRNVTNVLYCSEDGEWNFPAFECEQICGVEEPEFTTRISKNAVEYATSIPWHVGIYSNIEKDDFFISICDGTIVNAKLVISVAHCFWDSKEIRFYDPSDFKVVPGKYLRYFYESEPKQTQSIAQINYYKDFNNQTEFYAHDIVLLVLEDYFVFEPSIAPVCMEFELSAPDIRPGLLGELAGSKTTSSGIFKIIAQKFINVSVIHFNECIKSSSELSEPYLTQDKFCATYTKRPHKPSVGGGFVLPKIVDDKNLYFLRGVTSFHRADRKSNKIQVLLTNLRYHVNLLHLHLNKVIDDMITCPDKSNDDARLCGHSIETSITETPPVLGGSCLVPRELSQALTVYYDTQRDQEISKGSYAVPFAEILYRCKTNYTLVGSSNNFCLNGIWTTQNHPNCIKFCSPKSLNGLTIRATCEINGEQIECQQSHKPGTTVHIACALGYRKPADRIFTDVLICGENGEWDFTAFRCEQICGLKAPDVVPYVVGGEYVNITKVPWHVGIYSNIVNETYFSQICGGTILNAKLVVSAAHCFWDNSENGFYKPSNFKVAAGKYYRDLYHIEPIKPQTVDVEQLHFKQEYNDYAGYYALDIILLVLKDYIQFNSYIKPICVDYDLNFNEQQVQAGLIGRVAGWGLESSDSRIGSPVLKVIDLPAIEYNECKRILSAELGPFITGDKFCAGYTNGQSVCRGDSGGGLVFPKQIGLDTVYFLRGIVSTGDNKDGSCDNHKYTLFTNVQFHIKMISFYESHNRAQ